MRGPQASEYPTALLKYGVNAAKPGHCEPGAFA